MPPHEHWRTTGWREGRDPNAAFDTRYYVAGLGGPLPPGVDPLEHYRTAGRAEGRHPAPPPSPALTAMFSMMHRVAVPVPAVATTLSAARLGDVLTERLVGRRLLCLSIGHDAFAQSVGGVQLVTAAEQLRVSGGHGVHLHLSPAAPAPALAPPDGQPVVVRLLLDAEDIGTASAAAVGRAVAAASAPQCRIVVHSLRGHRPEEIVRLAATLATRIEFWLHDYAALCEAPQLLRNGYAFCGAPPVGSPACTICVHGEGRAAHRARSVALLRNATILAPSGTARAIAATGLDQTQIEVRPHLALLPSPGPPLARARAAAAPHIAFAGTPAFHKGFGDALGLLARHPGLEWFAAGANAPAGTTHLPARTDARDPWALSRALAGAAIDLVLVLSPWPETFCLVAHEAIAAGCDLLTLARSGHAAALVLATGRGVVFEDVAAVSRWLERDAAAYVADRRSNAPAGLMLAWSGGETPDPEPLLVARRHVHRPERIADAGWRWTLPPGAAGAMRLRSRWFVPNWLRAEPYDDRRLGLDVVAITLDGRSVDLGTLVDGWHMATANRRWTSGDAALDVGDAAVVALWTGGGGRYPA